MKETAFLEEVERASTRMLGRNGPWETPFGTVVEGLDVVKEWYTGYNGAASQGRLRKEGNSYIREEFPETDFIQNCRVLEDGTFTLTEEL